MVKLKTILLLSSQSKHKYRTTPHNHEGGNSAKNGTNLLPRQDCYAQQGKMFHDNLKKRHVPSNE